MGGLVDVLESILQSVLFMLIGEALPDEPIVGKVAASLLALIPAFLIGIVSSVYLCGDEKNPGWVFSAKAGAPVLIVISLAVYVPLMLLVW